MFIKIDFYKDDLWLSIPKIARYVLRVLFDHCSSDACTCYPTIKCLSEETGFSKHSISDAIKKLEELKAIKCERQPLSNGGRKNSYDLSVWRKYKAKKIRDAPDESP